MVKKHWAIYGNTKMQRVYCPKCKGMTLVVDGKRLCCDSKVNEKTRRMVNMVPNMSNRKRPSKYEQKKILDLQGNKCLYCNKPFGIMYTRIKNVKGMGKYASHKILYTKLHFDHLVPYVYSKQNKYNFVAACNICNGIKSSLMFNTVEEAFRYVEYNRKKKGIVYEEDMSSMPENNDKSTQ